MADDPVDGDGLVVRYVLDVDGYRIDEAESMLQFDEYADSVRAGGYCEGAIVLDAPGQEALSLDDALPFLVTHLCFGSLDGLSAGQTVTVPFFLTGIDVVASVRDREVWLDLAGGGSFHYEKVATMRGLYECGVRFSRFYARLWAGRPDRDLDVANLDRMREAAGAVLERGG